MRVALFLTLLTAAGCGVLVFGGESHTWKEGNSLSNFVNPLPWQRSHVSCDHALRKLRRSHVVASFPPDVQGDWVSKKCEVRPGPEFLLRRYSFNHTHVQATQFHYSDPDCSSPIYTLTAKASYSPARDSWLVPGATEVNYDLLDLKVMTYTDDSATLLAQHVNATCPNTATQPWRSRENHVLYHVTSPGEVPDVECAHALHFTFNELQLMRVEHAQNGGEEVKTLFLGDVHTELEQRDYYRPTAYQAPLQHTKVSQCAVCRQVDEADPRSPPHLSPRPSPQPPSHPPIDPLKSLHGEWVSEHCETRPFSLFLTRRLSFQPESRIWTGQYDFFSDPACNEAMFSLMAIGALEGGEPSNLVPRARELDVRLTNLRVIPHNHNMATMLNYHHADTCAKRGSWRPGVSQDVTATGGCEALGIKVPHMEYEIFKTEASHHRTRLYLGQRPSDGGAPDTPERRPTSYQAPLVQCSTPSQQNPDQHSSRHPNALPLVAGHPSAGVRHNINIPILAVLCWCLWMVL